MSEGKDFYNLEVSYFSQLDNVYAPFISCYPTAMAMAIDYCLRIENKDKRDIGCTYDIQLEDFINRITMSDEIQVWLKKNVGRLGSWIWKYKPRTIAYVEEYIFNKLMNKHGFRCQFTTEVSFREYCGILDTHKLPQVLHGNFSKKTRVQGHIVCATGYAKPGRRIIVNDPFGDAGTKYLDRDGEKVEYYFRDYFVKNKRTNTMWLTSILRH